MRNVAPFGDEEQSWRPDICPTLGMTEKGLLGGLGSTFVRLRKSASGHDELALDEDRERLITLLSVAADRSVAEAEVLPHVAAAAEHWQRGDRALANLRLVFAKLPNVADPISACRVALAEHLLDGGWSPHGLRAELGFAPQPVAVEKYNPNHVPSGHGRRSGQFDFRSGSIVVAGGEDDETYREHELFGETTPKQELEHGHPVAPTTGVPIIGGQPIATGVSVSTLDQLTTAARAAAATVGLGKGPVYGTAVHTEFKAQIEALGRDDLHAEQSYLNGLPTAYGVPGSVRVDAAEGSRDFPHSVYDLKTGGASLTSSRIQQLQSHLPERPDGADVDVHEVRP